MGFVVVFPHTLSLFPTRHIRSATRPHFSFSSSPMQLADWRDDDRLGPDLFDRGRHGEPIAEEVEAEEGRGRSRHNGHQGRRG